MTNEIIHILNYCIKGESKEIELKIKFVSNQFHVDFANLMDLCYKIKIKTERLTQILTEINDLRLHQEEGYKPKIKDLDKEVKSLSEDIEKSASTGFQSEQIRLAKYVLESNGLTDEYLFDDKFWQHNVTQQDLMNLLVACERKDYPKKKAVANLNTPLMSKP